MALVLPNSLHLHCPKSGGWFVRHAIRDLGIRYEELGHEHCNFRSGLLKHHDANWWCTKSAFLFVRHPLSWYQSLWSFRCKNGWSMTHPLDFNCASNDFGTFVNKVLTWWPDGWVSRTYGEFLGVPDGMRVIIGRQERLRSDLVEILRMTGDLTETVYPDTSPANESSMDGKTSAELGVYTPELRRRVLQVEHQFIKRWYEPGWELRGPQVSQ